ncbi:hypothetical protein C8R45DRAFT_1095381 [Mycena sanguinolenta]|nr:hypothetical protein C8R45DRAFT_1095381 [Mycena sanguinolenta]
MHAARPALRGGGVACLAERERGARDKASTPVREPRHIEHLPLYAGHACKPDSLNIRRLRVTALTGAPKTQSASGLLGWLAYSGSLDALCAMTIAISTSQPHHFRKSDARSRLQLFLGDSMWRYAPGAIRISLGTGVSSYCRPRVRRPASGASRRSGLAPLPRLRLRLVDCCLRLRRRLIGSALDSRAAARRERGQGWAGAFVWRGITSHSHHCFAVGPSGCVDINNNHLDHITPRHLPCSSPPSRSAPWPVRSPLRTPRTIYIALVAPVLWHIPPDLDLNASTDLDHLHRLLAFDLLFLLLLWLRLLSRLLRFRRTCVDFAFGERPRVGDLRRSTWLATRFPRR